MFGLPIGITRLVLENALAKYPGRTVITVELVMKQLTTRARCLPLDQVQSWLARDSHHTRLGQ